MTGLCIVLKRLVYPTRYSDMISTFCTSVPELCMVYNKVIGHNYEAHSHCVTQWNQTLLSAQNLQLYAESVFSKRAALENC